MNGIPHILYLRMTNDNSSIVSGTFQPESVLNPLKQDYYNNQQRRTPSPTDATISESFSAASSTNNINLMSDEYSLTPGGVDASSQSSPGSASDHMGVIPNTAASSNSSGAVIKPLFSGSSVLAAFDAGKPNISVGLVPSIPISNSGITTKSPVLARRKGESSTLPSNSDIATVGNGSISGGATGNTSNRRQSRLQRNRESARLSRKRRKQYLELLEERVDNLSEELDRSRRDHVAAAVNTLNQKRNELIQRGLSRIGDIGEIESDVKALANHLSRTNEELRIATTFQYQQLKSFSISSSIQFTLWLTLQTDTYFRGGRTASERLSAARIGERMLSSGTESAAPSQSMWPLFCNEVGVSYDQEEKLRAMQRTLIQDKNTWVDRHTAHASRKVVELAHDVTQALTVRAGERERSTLSCLSSSQRLKMMHWSQSNRNRIIQSTAATGLVSVPQRNIDAQHHVAANLYIISDRLEKVLSIVPRAAPLVTGAALKRLSHRPSFEPLGASEERANELNREGSYPSSGSLKRNASEMSMECDESNCAQKPHVPVITPVDAQATAAPFVKETLNAVLDLLPPEPPSESMMTTSELEQESGPSDDFLGTLEIPMPTPVLSVSTSIPTSIIYQAPAAYTQSAPSFGALLPPHEQHHVRKSSFLPAHLNVVPEELWPDEADDFLLDMIEGDWAIGGGIDMDMNE